MKQLVNFFRGTITAVVTGVDLERFLNLCAKEGLHFWAVDWREPFTMALKVTPRGFAILEQVGAQCQCTVSKEGRRGLPFFLFRFRKRYALIAGVTLCMLTVTICSNFVFVIDIQGNEKVTKAEILSQLRQFGVKPGAYGPSIDERELSNKMLLAMDELAFLSLNLHGTRAEVIVREEIPKPALVEEEEPTHIVSTATGIITHMEALSGDAMCKEGDTVMEGEILISGFIDIQEADYSNADLGSRLVHAQGNVYARTWHTIRASIPLTSQVKELTGEETRRYCLNLLGHRVKFYGNGGISFAKYDKITSTKTWVLSDGSILPISLERETFRQFETTQRSLELAGADTLLREQLRTTLQERIGEEGEIIRTDFVAKQADGFLEVTLLAECSQQIGKMVPVQQSGAGDESAQYQEQAGE